MISSWLHGELIFDEWLIRLITWQIWLIAGLGVIIGVAFLHAHPLHTTVGVAIAGGYIALLYRARARVQCGEVLRAMVCMSLGLMIIGVAGGLLFPTTVPLIAIVPLLAIGITMPFLDNTLLRGLSIVAWCILLVESLLSNLTSFFVPASPPAWLLLILGLIGGFGLVLMLFYQHQHRLRLMVRQLQDSNAALQAVQADLELQVAKRTAELHEREMRYRAISELTSDYIYAVRFAPDGNVHLEWITNSITHITGYTLEQLNSGETWSKFIHVDDRQMAEQRLLIVRSGQSYVQEFRIVDSQGRLRWVRDYGRPLFDEQQQVVGMLGAAQDITAQKQTEERKLQLQRKLLETQHFDRLGRLAGGIAHDFNNLLVSIQGNVNLAQLDTDPTDPTFEALVQIERAALRASHLTRQILAYAGKGRFVVEACDLSALVAEMTQQLQALTPAHIRLEYCLAPELPSVELDTKQFHQVVMNLVVNAVEAIGEHSGTIAIATGMRYYPHELLVTSRYSADLPAGEYVELVVADTGCGIDDALMEMIFDPFFSTKFTGRGLGLSAVMGIVRAHGGTVQVCSQVGCGTTFTLLLPTTRHPVAEVGAHSSAVVLQAMC